MDLTNKSTEYLLSLYYLYCKNLDEMQERVDKIPGSEEEEARAWEMTREIEKEILRRTK